MTAPGAFTYSAATPGITGITPPSVSELGDQLVTLKGVNFLPITALYLGAQQLDFTVVDNNTITFTPPPGPAGATAIILTGTGGSTSKPFTITQWAPPAPFQAGAASTRRSAWLTRSDGTGVLWLDDYVSGYACLELDIGYPDVRAVVSNKPDINGTDDRTRFFGARVVTAKLYAWNGLRTVDEIAGLFAPYLDPSQRFQLHYTRNAAQGQERILNLRASAFSGPMGIPAKREMQLAWSAPDPYLYAALQSSAVAIPGLPGLPGRTYPLTFPRTYPPGSGAGTSGKLNVLGDVAVWPTVTIYGPVTGPTVTFYSTAGPAIMQINFSGTLRLDAGQYITVDTAAHSAALMGDPGQSVINQLIQAATYWAPIPPGAPAATIAMTGSNMAANVTNAVATWRDAYLT